MGCQQFHASGRRIVRAHSVHEGAALRNLDADRVDAYGADAADWVKVHEQGFRFDLACREFNVLVPLSLNKDIQFVDRALRLTDAADINQPLLFVVGWSVDRKFADDGAVDWNLEVGDVFGIECQLQRLEEGAVFDARLDLDATEDTGFGIRLGL